MYRSMVTMSTNQQGKGNSVKRLQIAVTLVTMVYSSVFAQQAVDWTKVEIETTDLGQNVYLLNWQGGDSLFLVGDDGVLLVDTSVPQMGTKIKDAIARVSLKPINL